MLELYHIYLKMLRVTPFYVYGVSNPSTGFRTREGVFESRGTVLYRVRVFYLPCYRLLCMLFMLRNITESCLESCFEHVPEHAAHFTSKFELVINVLPIEVFDY